MTYNGAARNLRTTKTYVEGERGHAFYIGRFIRGAIPTGGLTSACTPSDHSLAHLEQTAFGQNQSFTFGGIAIAPRADLIPVPNLPSAIQSVHE